MLSVTIVDTTVSGTADRGIWLSVHKTLRGVLSTVSSTSYAAKAVEALLNTLTTEVTPFVEEVW